MEAKKCINFWFDSKVKCAVVVPVYVEKMLKILSTTISLIIISKVFMIFKLKKKSLILFISGMNKRVSIFFAYCHFLRGCIIHKLEPIIRASY